VHLGHVHLLSPLLKCILSVEYTGKRKLFAHFAIRNLHDLGVIVVQQNAMF